jgi:2-keto-4-pentenoate hydratase/2-oxohepta-3-ene-1,7-dioic acid hydratase in catechol pathway
MKLVTFTTAQSGPTVGLLDGDDHVVALAAANTEQLVASGVDAKNAANISSALFCDMVTFIGYGEWGKDLARRVVSAASGSTQRLHLAAITLLPPLQPVALRDGLLFETHMKNFYENLMEKEVPKEFYDFPVYYKGNPTTVVGTDTDVHWPSYSDDWDYELELGVVIGRTGVDIPVEEAESYIYGLTNFNDFSARDTLKKEIAVGLGPAKSKDFATGIGPWLVTMDEIEDLYNLEMIARVNGEEWSRGNTGEIHWKLADVISRMSQSEPLRVGEIFGSGTVAYGCGLELGKYLKDGDEVEIEISGLGVLRNTVSGHVK